VAWWGGNAGGQTHPVGKKKPNRWGLHDMSGNVSEWVWDWFGRYPSRRAAGYAGPEKGTFRICRGGSWDSAAVQALRPSARVNGTPIGRSSMLGFRCARTGIPRISVP
jgi:sulfatase modifying factor 1